MRTIGYVVIEFNQASGRPSIAFQAPDLYDDVEDAEVHAVSLTRRTQEVGRRERYAVATVEIEEDE
ncbi:hypothetical protein HOU47_gp65 [Arthrobacter phage Constance]|uniref:Uncharacterized protein n=1 Tax=Arthrobacter phage Constance TaxID=2419950 RepID=A0A3G2KEV6_9CAUD|nr:hypothetical protein HOU47_gp65 [Arthrobacter phage Constance]AYN57471.1 hypothetical protein PBI_CONSTANCE_65 [Arthrobacter phage Constance]